LSTTLFNRTVTRGRTSVTSRLPLTLLCVSLFFEYLGIHDTIPILGKLKVQTAFLALFFILVVARQIRKAKVRLAPQSRLSIEQLAECLRLSWVGLLVSATFVSVLGYPHLYYLTALTLVVHRLAVEESMSPKREPSAARRNAIGRWSTI